MREAIEQAKVWMKQGRADRAEPELRRALAADPDNATAHAFLSLCLTDLDRAADATDEAQQAIARAPQWPLAHYALAVAYVARGRADEARRAIDESLRLRPYDADAWAVKGQVELLVRDWPAAAAAAERGLALDAEHVDCSNVRAIALGRLGDRTASVEVTERALALDPENDTTHAVVGWTRLEDGDLPAAQRHFTEALRINPNNEDARAGLLEVLKARNVVYRTMLKFFMWMGRQSKRTVWIVIIGLWIVPRAIRGIAKDNPALQPVLYPIVALMIGFIYLTWVIDPIFDALLFLHPLGRHALSPRERTKALSVVICLGVALLCGVLAVATGMFGLLFPGLLLLMYVIPLNVAFEAQERYRRIAIGAAVALGAIGLAQTAVGLVTFAWIDDSTLDGLGSVASAALFLLYLLGVMALSFLGNRWALDTRQD